MSIDGILNLSKPVGPTSHDVILKVRKLLKTRKIGHTGTLDPQVQGVLPICIGRATKLVEYLQDLPKTYVAEVTFGISTDTEDQTGQIIEDKPDVSLKVNQIHDAFQSFIGSYEQIPPMYSAVKMGGKKLYELAREGIVIERATRKVEVYELSICETSLDLKYPKVSFQVRCSKGTYIRTLCVDLGRALGVPAHMSHLIRIESAGFRLEDSYTLEELEKAIVLNQINTLIIPLDKALTSLPQIIVPDFMIPKIQNGQPIYPRFPLPSDLKEGERVRVMSSDERLLAIHIIYNQAEIWSKPEKIISLQG